MADAIITLTTDFGEDSPYVAAMKGVLLSINPTARLVDLSHVIPPQDLRHTACFLAASMPYFPAGVTHLVVVDPGVGSQRALLCVELDGSRLVVPDNGCWTTLEGKASQPPRVIRLDNSRYWRHPVSPTFHGRDILAPVAAHLSLGVPAESLGEEIREWVRLPTPSLVRTPTQIAGEVHFIDHFGNLITNIPALELAGSWTPVRRILVAGQEVTHHVRSYADAPGGTLVSLFSSTGHLEIALTLGNAARYLQCGVGALVTVDLAAPDANSVGPE